MDIKVDCVAGLEERNRELKDNQYWQYIRGRVRAKRKEIPGKPEDKIFRAKNPEIGVLESYEGSFPDTYWDKWTKRELSDKPESWLKPGVVEQLAKEVNIDQDWINKTCSRLANGADIGCRGKGREPTRERNSPSAEAEGERLADTLQSWVKAGIVAGPFRPEELPWQDYTTSPLVVRLKPDNSVRIILDMSAPHLTDGPGRPVDPELARSVNDGIRKEDFPTTMTSTSLVLESIHRVGVPCEACKVDWSSAYKHQAVRMEDRKLQCFAFGGRIFVETQCTFGCSSSPGIYDAMSWLIVEIAGRRCGANREALQKQLDDVIYFGVKGTGTCGKFYQEYKEVCEKVGVKLAPEDDPEKAFSPASEGIILGVEYNFNNWTWRMPQVKMVRLVRQLDEIVKEDEVKNELAMSVVGKLTHYRVLVRDGHWERSFLLKLPEGNAKETRRPVTENMRIQARWWQVALLAADEGERIPDRRIMEKLDRVEYHTDAAGGSGSVGVGMGGVIIEQRRTRWFFYPWGEVIRFNMKNSLKERMGQKLSMLEGLAVLTGLAAGADSLAGKAVTAFTDNIGFYYAWANKGSPDLLTYTVAKAVHDVAEGLEVDITVRKEKRCSNREAKAADALSKCDFPRAFENMTDRDREPLEIPRTILRWAEDPTPTATLGRVILREIEGRFPWLTVRDWRAWEKL